MQRSLNQFMRANTMNLNSDKDLKGDQVAELREILNRFEGRRIKAREFRILQGVLQNDFGKLEQAKKQAKVVFDKQKKDFKSKNVKPLKQ